MIKLCVFDLDGTTVDTLASIAYFANRILLREGYLPCPVEAYRTLAGGGAAKLWANLAEARHIPPSDAERMKNAWIDEYAEDHMYLARPFDGIVKMLSDLRAAGIKTAIVTNKHEKIASRICGTLFPDLLDDLVSDHPGMALKPDPGELLALMKKYDAPGHATLYCGDHEIDMITGTRAGAATVGVTWGFHSRERLRAAGAGFIAEVPDDITKIAKSI
ncbi:MAG: HAD family hydrolase [Clostridia bacterium]|nr:HAD family hydrolase [Clostridia bacterium]